jgi:hypothetical protein
LLGSMPQQARPHELPISVILGSKDRPSRN